VDTSAELTTPASPISRQISGQAFALLSPITEFAADNVSAEIGMFPVSATERPASLGHVNMSLGSTSHLQHADVYTIDVRWMSDSAIWYKLSRKEAPRFPAD
jgi:hypothetical protein